jgi:hypothetical protein
LRLNNLATKPVGLRHIIQSRTANKSGHKSGHKFVYVASQTSTTVKSCIWRTQVGIFKPLADAGHANNVNLSSEYIHIVG